MTYIKAAVAVTLGVYTLGHLSIAIFQMGCKNSTEKHIPWSVCNCKSCFSMQWEIWWHCIEWVCAADALQAGASQFEASAGKLKRKFWWKNMKVKVICFSWLLKL